MFQNINEDTMNNSDYNKSKKYKKVDILTNVFNIKNIPIYIITLMIAMVEIKGQYSPFGISMLSACVSSSIPILGVLIFGLIGTFISVGASGALTYILTTLVLLASIFLFKARVSEEEKNEKIKLAKNIFISTLIVQIARMGIAGLTLYDLLAILSYSIIAVVFYKIFVNSIIVIRDFNEEKAYSIEEILGASLLLSIAFSAFGGLNIYGFSIRNILSILIVLILGWQNGVLVGATSGVTIGVTLGVITASDPIMIAAYAISGMIAGILNRFGKIGVIVGFTLGNIILAYVSNGFTVELIHFKEILIASIGLLAVPRTIQINIEEFIGKSKLLPVFSDRALNKSKQTSDKLNNVSETIEEIAKTYKVEEKVEKTSLKTNKQIFIEELLDNLEGYEENILFEDISKENGPIVNEIFKLLIEKQQMTRELLLKVFESCNCYIVGFDNKQISDYLEENIAEMIRIINMSYKISKTKFVWEKKLEENKKNIEIQLKGVSKAISNIANNIEKDIESEEQFKNEKKQIIELLKNKEINIKEISIQFEDRFLIELYIDKSNVTDIEYIEKTLSKILKENIVFNQDASCGTRLSFISDDKFIMAIGYNETTKSNSDISGDNILNIRLKDGKYLIALSDGMGTGNEANQSSNKALKLLENLLISGFDKKTSMELINTSLINQNEDIFATLDIAIIDLYKGNIEFIKSGACPTYIKNNHKVQLIKSNSLPAGIINVSKLQTFDRDIEENDILVMCSDGVLDSNVEYKNKELWVKYILEDIETTNTNKISEIIINEAIDNNYGVAKDDMSVIVCKFIEK